jgi:hypothetical protein
MAQRSRALRVDPRFRVFGARLQPVRRGLCNDRRRDPLDLLAQLYFRYPIETPDMAYTVDDFKRDTRRLLIQHVREFDPDEIQAILNHRPQRSPSLASLAREAAERAVQGAAGPGRASSESGGRQAHL